MFLWQENITQCKQKELKHSSIMGFHESFEDKKNLLYAELNLD